MARTRRKTSSGGNTWFGVLAGLILGLGAAVVVALFVTQVPMPFVDKASREPAKTLLPDARDAPDPNFGLSGKPGLDGTSPLGPVEGSFTPIPGLTPPSAIPGTGSTPSAPRPDDIGKLIASLDDKQGTSPPANPSAPASKPAPSPATAPAANADTVYFLQAGAFRSENDADSVKARILLLGLPVQIQKAQINGSTIHRVRVGPFKGIDEMNRSRAKLGEEKIESSVVRQ
jgi:cell division protein FtsN